MKSHLLLGGMLLFLSAAAFCDAKTVTLAPGEQYREGDLAVVCTPPEGSDIVRLSECQIWDDFQQKCLFERTVYTANALRCEEMCQHWDRFSETCRFQTSCSFLKNEGTFLQTRCESFDRFSNSCIKTSQDIIKAGNKEQTDRP